jgi:tRNA-2-methylthio-N6-dimethylallyladenosine synthase
VNSYGKKEGLCTFPELLERVSNIPGLLRIRFTTSHPADLSEELMTAFRDLDTLCKHIHLPVQSGSNAILKRMNRRYTREVYLDKAARLRTLRPDMALTSDMIVGFPGETQTDFNQTLELMREVEFDGLFAFKYSDRPQASAGRFSGKVDEAEKDERLRQLLSLQEHYTLKKNKELVGTVQQVLVEGPSKKQADNEFSGVQLTGRTGGNKIVHFLLPEGSDTKVSLIGRMIPVRIEQAFSHSLRGNLQTGRLSDKFTDFKGADNAA